jgi:hypothetical protein
MREARFSTRLLLAAGAAAALIAVPVSVSPHALSWQVAAAQSARGLHSFGRGHGHHHVNAFGHRDERGYGTAREASAGHAQGRVPDGRGWHYGRGWDDGGNVQDSGGGSAPLDEEAPPS